MARMPHLLLLSGIFLCILHVRAYHDCESSSWVYTHSVLGDICYWYVSSRHDAMAANEKCIDKGGLLAYIPNDEAFTVALGLLNDRNPYGKAFIGYRRYDENNLEIQSSGYLQLWAPWTPLTTSWPNSGGLECIVMDGYTESWHENDCYEDVSAVCSPPFRLSQATTAIPTTNTSSTSTTSTSITTSTVPSTSTTSQVDDTLSSVQDCHCQCNSSSEAIIIYPITNITDELQAKLDNLKTETMVDEETLSATLRKRTSASDSRPSSAYVGYLGIALLSIILGGILLLDLPRLILFIKR